MAIRHIELGSHSLEIDTTYGMVTIYGTGYRVDLSLPEASNMLSAMLMVINPSSMLQSENIDPLHISAIGNPSEKTERVLTHVDSLASQHFTECASCMKVLQASYCDTLEGVVSQIATCLAKAEGVKPYLEAGIITMGNIEYLLATPLQKILDKINVTVCSGCANGWCEGCVPDVIDEAENYANSYLGTAPSEISEEAKQRYARISQPEAYRQFLESTVNDEEYNAWLDHVNTPKAEDY